MLCSIHMPVAIFHLAEHDLNTSDHLPAVVLECNGVAFMPVVHGYIEDED